MDDLNQPFRSCAANGTPHLGLGPAQFVLQLINPKAYAVNTLLFGGYGFMGGGPGEIAAKFLIINVVWVPVHLFWLGAGVRLGRLELGDRTQRLINIGMAISLAIVVLLAAREML